MSSTVPIEVLDHAIAAIEGELSSLRYMRGLTARQYATEICRETEKLRRMKRDRKERLKSNGGAR